MVVLDQPGVEIAVDIARQEQNRAYRVLVEGEWVMWISDGARRFQPRLTVGAHCADSRSVAIITCPLVVLRHGTCSARFLI